MRVDYLEDSVLPMLKDDEIINLYNEWAQSGGYEELWPMFEFDELVANGKSYNEVQEILDDDFNHNDKYFYFSDATGYCTSTNDIYDVVDLTDLARWLNDSEDDMGIYELSVVFGGEEEEDRLASAYADMALDERKKVCIALGLYDEEDEEDQEPSEIEDALEDLGADVIYEVMDGSNPGIDNEAVSPLKEIHEDYRTK